LRKLQELKEGLRELRDIASLDREPELQAMVEILSDRQDAFLDGIPLDERTACLELACVNALSVSVWRDLGVTVDE